MDMARKFLQMGYTRARRYANHPTGRKYDTALEGETVPRSVLPQSADWATGEKAESARIFYEWYRKAHDDPDYAAAKRLHKEKYG